MLQAEQRDELRAKHRGVDGGPTAEVVEKGIAALAHLVGESLAFSSSSILDSAILLLAYSALDHVADECLRLSVRIAPHEWYALVKKKELNLEQFEELGSVDAARRHLVAKQIGSLVAGPLEQKIRRLRALCGGAQVVCQSGYSYEESTLKRLNEARTSIAHDAGVFDGALGKDVGFLLETCKFLLDLFEAQYDIHFDRVLQVAGIKKALGFTVVIRLPDGTERFPFGPP
jgi:hypothetical protein